MRILPELIMKNFVAGIDFGTTNSSAAISDGGSPRMVEVEAGKDTIPTALFFPEKSDKVYFGREAQNKYTGSEVNGRFMRSMKRILGTDLMRSGTLINGRPVKFETIIGLFIKHLKKKIDSAAGTPVDSVVMGRPVHFRDNDPEGDKRAQDELERIAKSAGFKNVAFQYEPIAAAFAHEQNLTSDKLAFVIDIGGGTSDFTVINLSPERKHSLDRTLDVLANTGVRIGGNDFDKSLSLKVFMPLFGMGTEYKSYNKNIPVPTSPYISLSTWSSINDVYNYKTLNMVRGYVTFGLEPEKMHRLYELIENRLGHTNLNYVEQTKMKLSTEMSVNVNLSFLSDKPNLNAQRTVFEKAILQDILKIEKSIEECLLQANVTKSDIELVILTGGSTEIPYITQIVHKHFPKADISSVDRLSSVGLGLAYDSIRRYAEYLNLNKQKVK